ncbi:MAG: TetR/AcrR family transcriptional regulator [Pseudomonadota bacterium]
MINSPESELERATLDSSGTIDNSHSSDLERRPHAPRKSPRQARSKHLVEAILEAATRVFDAQGYAKGNTNCIATLAGVSVGSLYQYFPNKKALITALHDRHIREVGQSISAAFDKYRGQSLDELIEHLVLVMLQAHQKHPRLQQVLHTELPFYKNADAKDRGMAEPAFCLHALLRIHRPDLADVALDQATAMLMFMGEALVHAAILNPPPGLALSQVATGIAQALKGYLLPVEQSPANSHSAATTLLS